ncbi:MAG: hypothetical protein IM600_10235 [Bacteroidetes bacterium]|jgi:hypothetical protein|nr:hypothetical protein [Bacteroidota bacterium]MCA6443794.1 hypothetical protein [Bacteroidota bacterium]
MNKKLLVSIITVTVIGISIFACKKKTDNGAITPTYKEQAVGTAGNPNVGNQTVTGTNTLTNPATSNSQLIAGGSGWLNSACVTSNSLSVKGTNGTTNVTITFGTILPMGSTTLQVASVPVGNSACSIQIDNAPNQPSGITWFGKAGTVVVQTATTGISAQCIGVQCVQQNFNFPTVSLSGSVSCQ